MLFRSGRESLGVSTFTAADARKAQTQNMGKFPRNMLHARALTNGCRWYCPDVFGGPIYTPDELGAEVDEDGQPVSAETPAPRKALKPRAEREDFPGEAVYGGRREEPVVEAEVVEADETPDDPDALAEELERRLTLVDSADEATLNRWFVQARAEWPDPLKTRLVDVIRAEAARRKGQAG